jgi:predicted AAA+ superfamily ATPase
MVTSGSLIPRWASAAVVEAMGDTRAVFVMGPRQAGKSTLVSQYAAARSIPDVLTLDDKAVRDAAANDPAGFIAGLRRPVVLDEVQRAPDLLLAVKEAVDHDPSPGQVLLTGSSNIHTNRRVKDALTGRMELVRLLPLAQGEIRGTPPTLVDKLFAGEPPALAGEVVGRDAFVEPVVRGGFPEARLRAGRRRDRWFRDYVDTTIDRELRDISDVTKLEFVPRLLRLLAAQTAGLTNYANLADRLSLNEKTVKSYCQLLETVFLIRRLPAWRPGLAGREVHAPKTHFVDTGLLLHVLGADEGRLRDDAQVTGKALESFVAMELVKLSTASQTDPSVYHYRFGRDEVDVVLEARSGDVVGIEVKASATPAPKDRRGLEKLRDSAGHRFKCGIIIYSGARTVPLGDRLWAVPVAALWAAT